MARERVVSMSITNEEYEKISALRIKDGKIRSVSEVLRELVIPSLMNGHNPTDNKPDDKPVEQQDSKQDAEQEAQPQANDFFKDVSF